MKKIFFFSVIFILSGVNLAHCQDDPLEKIISAIRESDARTLAASFNNTIELSLPENENTFSAAQAEMILKDFFKKYPPDSFTLIQNGATDPSSRFAICNYLSASVQYQVFILLRKEKELFLIHEMKFEEKKY